MCSSTSEQTTRSNSPSANGSERASPSLMSAEAPKGTSPASFIAPKSSSTPASSSASWSKAITSAPRRYISNACRPAPQPMSMTRSPGRSPSRSKSTVSTQDLLVRRRRRHRDRVPAELLLGTGATCRAVPLTSVGVVEQRADRVLELPHVAGSDQVGAQAVRPDDLGDGAGPRHDQRCRAGHQLGGRQREALVERRHARDLGGPHHLD